MSSEWDNARSPYGAASSSSDGAWDGAWDGEHGVGQSAQRPTGQPLRGPLSSRIAAQQNSQPPRLTPQPETHDVYGNPLDYAAYNAPNGSFSYPGSEADLWNNAGNNAQPDASQQWATSAAPTPLLPAPQLPGGVPSTSVRLPPQPGVAGGGDQAALLQASLREYDRMEREVTELTMLVRQTGAEAEQLAQRKTIIASQVREMDERIETYSRAEIRDTYRRASEAEMRAFMISEQREQLQAKLQAYERYRDHLRRTIDFLRLLPTAMSAALAAAQSVAQSTAMPTPAGPAAAPYPAPAPAPQFQPSQQPARPQPAVRQPGQTMQPAPQQTPQPGQAFRVYDAGSAALPDAMGAAGVNDRAQQLDQVPTAFLGETGEDITTFLSQPSVTAAPPARLVPMAPPQGGADGMGAGMGAGMGDTAASPALARVLQSQEALRQRLAQQLHDGPAQALANVALAAEMCERVIQTEPGNAAHALEELGRLKEQVNAALQETRKFIFELRPMALDDLGLVATLRRYTAGIASQYGVDTMVNAPNGEPRLPPEVSSALFRIAQEALTNAVQHGHAHHALVTVLLHQGHVLLVVDDDGGGFDVEQAMAWAAIRHSTGIPGMQERAGLIAGSLRIQSERGRGSRVEISAPLSLPANQINQINQADQR